MSGQGPEQGGLLNNELGIEGLDSGEQQQGQGGLLDGGLLGSPHGAAQQGAEALRTQALLHQIEEMTSGSPPPTDRHHRGAAAAIARHAHGNPQTAAGLASLVIKGDLRHNDGVLTGLQMANLLIERRNTTIRNLAEKPIQPTTFSWKPDLLLPRESDALTIKITKGILNKAAAIGSAGINYATRLAIAGLVGEPKSFANSFKVTPEGLETSQPFSRIAEQRISPGQRETLIIAPDFAPVLDKPVALLKTLRLGGLADMLAFAGTVKIINSRDGTLLTSTPTFWPRKRADEIREALGALDPRQIPQPPEMRPEPELGPLLREFARQTGILPDFGEVVEDGDLAE
jgi:hypothetical protein